MTRRMLELVPLAAVLFLAAFLPAPAVADVLYTQPTDYPGGGFYYSQVPTAGGTPVQQVYDNILPAGVTAGTATSLSWEGGYKNPDFTAGPSLGGITGFTIGFYADGGGAPAQLLQVRKRLGQRRGDPRRHRQLRRLHLQLRDHPAHALRPRGRYDLLDLDHGGPLPGDPGLGLAHRHGWGRDGL